MYCIITTCSVECAGTVVMKQYIKNLTKRLIFAVLDVQLRRLYPFL